MCGRVITLLAPSYFAASLRYMWHPSTPVPRTLWRMWRYGVRRAHVCFQAYCNILRLALSWPVLFFSVDINWHIDELRMFLSFFDKSINCKKILISFGGVLMALFFNKCLQLPLNMRGVKNEASYAFFKCKF